MGKCDADSDVLFSACLPVSQSLWSDARCCDAGSRVVSPACAPVCLCGQMLDVVSPACLPVSPPVSAVRCRVSRSPCLPVSPFSFTGLQNNMVLGAGVGGGHDKHTRSTAADASFTPEAFTGPTFGSRTMGHHFVLALCVAYVPLLRVRAHPAPLLTCGSRHFGRVIRSCWTLTLKFSLVVRLILSRILRHLLVRYLHEALCSGVGYLLHCRVFALPG